MGIDMKTKTLFLSLACLLLTFSSCQKTEPGENGSTQKQEQVKEDTPESILLAVQDKYSYDSYAETSNDYTVIFHNPTPLTLIKEYPEGIKSVTIQKGEIISWKDNTSNVAIRFKSGKTATLNKYTLLVVNYADLNPISFNSVGESKTINFTVERNTEKNLTVTAESDNPEFTANVSINNDKTSGFVTITNNTSSEKGATISLYADNGVGRKQNEVSVSYENFYFVQKPEWNPWNEPDTRIDGKSKIELDFDVELARKFVLTVNKGDLGITTSVSSDAKSWLSTKMLVNENGNGTQTVQIEISMTKNAGNQYRTGVVTVKSSKGKEIKAVIRQIGEKMTNSMRSSLMAFYNACNGPKWDDNTGWGTNTEIVDWYGITLSSCPKGYGYTTATDLYDKWDIEMESNNISGTIPEAFWNIVNKFQTIDLGNNKLAEQTLDERIWHSHLRKLNLADCYAFTGKISHNIANAKSLYFLDLHNNKLSGQIPDELYYCAELYWLTLGNTGTGYPYDKLNNYNCSISPKIANLKKLEHFDSESCNLNGEIPAEIYKMDNLTFFSVTNNWIKGSISKDIQYTKSGRFISIGANCISGTIPEEVGKTDLDLGFITGENHLSGYLPEAARYMKTGWNRSDLHGSAGQMKPNAPKHYEGDGTAHAFSEVCEFVPMPDWAKERFGISEWNYIEQKKPKYPYADDLQYPANEYYYDGKDWRHPKYEHPARFYHKVNGVWTYDPDWNWNHTTDPPINEVPEW